jgi:hypothetical protein
VAVAQSKIRAVGSMVKQLSVEMFLQCLSASDWMWMHIALEVHYQARLDSRHDMMPLMKASLGKTEARKEIKPN